MSQQSEFFNNVNKEELANYVALRAIFLSHGLEIKELEESFIQYAKQVNYLKVAVLKQLEQTGLVDDTLAKLNVKVQPNA